MSKKMTAKKSQEQEQAQAQVTPKERALAFVEKNGLAFHSNYKKFLGITSWEDMDGDRFDVVDGELRYHSLVTSDYLAFNENAVFTLKSMITGKIPTLRVYMCDGTPRSMTGDQDIFVDGFSALFDASQKDAVVPQPKAGYEKIVNAFKISNAEDLVPEELKAAKTPEGRLRAAIQEWGDACSRPLVVHKWIICECLMHTVCQPRALDPKMLLSFIPSEWYVKAGGSSSYGIGELITQMANGAFCNYLPSVQKVRPADFHFTPIRHLVSCVCVIARDTPVELLEYWLNATDTDVTARRSSGGGSGSTPRTPRLSLDDILGLLE